MRRISLFFLLISLPVLLFAQTAGKISGTITTDDGTPLAGANVLIEGSTFGAATDGDGRYTILNVPIGIYTLKVDYIGYKPITMSNIEIKGGLTTRQSFQMESSVIAGEEVIIVGEKRLIEPSATSSIRTVGAEEIENSANRDVGELLDLQPGVVTQNGNIHIRGSRDEEVGYTLDGVNIKNMVGSGRLVTAIPEALSELAVEAGGYSAEIGGANSGIIRQVLKTGGDKLSGSFRVETDGLAPALSGDESLSYGYQDITATLGGPLGSRVRFFGALRVTNEDDWEPTYWEPFEFMDGELQPTLVAGITPDGDSISIAFTGEDIPSKTSENISFNGTTLLDFNPLTIRFSAVIDNLTYRDDFRTPIYYMYNTGRLPERIQNKSLFALRGNYFLSPKTFVSVGYSMFSQQYMSYDPNFDHDSVLDLMAWGNPYEIESVNQDWADEFKDANGNYTYSLPENYYVAQFSFQRPGDIPAGFSKTVRDYNGIDGKFTMQRGAHEFVAGFDFKNYTYRRYYFFGSTMENMNRAVYVDSSITIEDIENENSAAESKLRLFNARTIGYDVFMNELDSGPDGARQPYSQSYYFNDKYEADNLILNIGLRLDRFFMDDMKMKDPSNPGWDETNQGILEDEFTDPDVKGVVQPRVGLAFPVSDNTVFHLQYGKYAQMPDLAEAFKSTRWMSLVFGGQNYTPDPMGFDLDPIETNQYELGFHYQFTPDAALDITAFAKNTTGQLTIAKNELVSANASYGVDQGALYYINGDFSTANGVEFTMRTRRINRLQSYLSYTFTDARGVNSEPNSNAGNVTQDALAAPPAMISPLDYENKHRGAMVMDYRYGDNEGLLSNAGMNLSFRFNSGHPFTTVGGGLGQRAADEGALLDDARAREPQEPIGSSTTPWYFRWDMKMEKGFKLGNVELMAFVNVENLFDRKNVINVYNRTGNAYDDGFLTDPALSAEIVAAQGDQYVELYQNINLSNRQHLLFDGDFGFDVFDTPRLIRVGLSANF